MTKAETTSGRETEAIPILTSQRTYPAESLLSKWSSGLAFILAGFLESTTSSTGVGTTGQILPKLDSARRHASMGCPFLTATAVLARLAGAMCGVESSGDLTLFEWSGRVRPCLLSGDSMWQCVHCDQTVDDAFDCCWNCGTSREGKVDPDFVHADLQPAHSAEEEPSGRTVPRFKLRSLLISITCLCVIFAVLRTSAAPMLIFAICAVLLLIAILHLYAFLYGVLLAWIRWKSARRR